MAAKKKRRKSGRRRGPGLVWRVLFGHNGPTKAELKKAVLSWRKPQTFTLQVRHPETGKMVRQRMHIDADGQIQQFKAPAKKTVAKKQPPVKPAAKGGVSKPSKPSRASAASRTGQVRQLPAARVQAAAAKGGTGRAKPLSERVLRNPDGTLAGSRPATDPMTKATREYEQAMRNAAAADARARKNLGW